MQGLQAALNWIILNDYWKFFDGDDNYDLKITQHEARPSAE